MGIFIRVMIEESWSASADAQALVKQCPVEIFAWHAGRLVSCEAQEDECTLCELCLAVAPAGVLAIQKLYKDELLVSRGNNFDPAPTLTEPHNSRANQRDIHPCDHRESL